MPNTTIAEALKQAQIKLISENTEASEAKREAEYLVSYILNWTLSKLITHPGYILTDEEQGKFRVCLERRIQGEPFAYIKKSKSFWNLDLEVDPSVLIPRPETELLIEKILSLTLATHAKILDLGTGSGAIGIALGFNQPTWQIMATDLSPASLDMASRNAKKYKLDNIKFYLGSWFEAIESQTQKIKFDIIVSNPPYISPDSDYLKKGDVRFEPQHALIAANNGFSDLEQIILQAKKYLNLKGYLFVEHGYDQAKTVQDLFFQGGFVDVQTLKDIQGFDRVTYGRG